MSAPVAAEVLRELGAEPRKFMSVKGALLWYQAQLAQRLRVNRDLADVGTPRSAERAEVAVATFAAIAPCLKPHPADLVDRYGHQRGEEEVAEIRFRARGAMLCWLVAWYESDGGGDGTWLAEKASESESREQGKEITITPEAFRLRCLKTERVVRRRLEAALVLLPRRTR